MKDLKEYLNMKTITTYKSLYEKYDDIDSYILHGYMLNHINENNDIFDVFRKMSGFISVCIDCYENKQPGDIIMFMCEKIDELKNDYFNKIYIRFINSNTRYDYLSSTYTLNENIFDPVYINIDINCVDSVRHIIYALSSAYQKLHLNKYGNNIYSESLNNIESITDKDISDMMKYALVTLEHYKISENMSDMIFHTEYSDILQAFNTIYESFIYKRIKQMKSLIDCIELKERLTNIYKKINKIEAPSDKLYEMLSNDINKCWDCLIKNIYQCTYKYTNNNNITERRNTKIENINEYYKNGDIRIINGITNIDEILLRHTEFDYAQLVCGLVHWPYYTFESLGIFKGCKELVNSIEEKYKRGIDHITLKPTDCEFTDEINIIFRTSKKENICNGQYQSDEDNRWDEQKHKFNHITVIIYNADTEEYSDRLLKNTLTHELMHAYDDWILYKDGTSIYNKYNKYNYKEEFNKIGDKIKNDLDKLKNNNYIKIYDDIIIPNFKKFNQIIYYLNNYESKAFIGAINTYLDGREFSTTDELVRFLNREVPEYRIYKNIYYLLHEKHFRQALIDLGVKKSTVNILKKKSSKVLQKMINHIGCMMFKYRKLEIYETFDYFIERSDDIFKR